MQSVAKHLCCNQINAESIQKTIRLDEMYNNDQYSIFSAVFFLLKQKYPEKLIESGMNRAMNPERNALRNVSEQAYEPVITYVSTHNPQNPK